MNTLTTHKNKTRIKFSGSTHAPENMEVITISYNGKNKIANAIVNLIEASGVFDILRDNEPNETTIEAINELKNGGGFTANGLDDLFKQLQS